jgi:DNA-directed RNA polymerase specialized sigma24 family protein
MDNNIKLQKLEERQLISRILGGEELAWKQFLLRYKSCIFSAIRTQLKKFHGAYDKHTANDLYQDILVKLHEKTLKSFYDNTEKQTLLKSYLYTVSINQTKDFIKSKQGRYKLDELSVSPKDENSSLEDMFFVDEKSTEELYQHIEGREILLDEILNQDYQTQDILQKYLLGDQNKTISEELKIPVNKINKTIFNFKVYLEKKYKVAA